MRPLRVLPVALLVVAFSAAASGCFGAEEVPVERTVRASGGVVSDGWAYDGNVSPGDATLEGKANNPGNTGAFVASFTHNGSRYVVAFDAFSGSKDFMDGGVAFDLVEHGDSGVADASIPRILARIAAWGTATVTRDGEPLVGTAGDRWSAHLMVSDTTVRGPDGRILKADGNTPYDPTTPADATRVEGDPQAFLKIVHPDGEDAVRAPVNVTKAVTCQGQCAAGAAVDVPTQKGATGLDIAVAFTGTPAPLGQATVTLLDANGTVVDTREVQLLPGQTPAPVAFRVEPADIMGAYQVKVEGEGAFTAMVTATAAYDDHPFLVLTWDDPTLA